MSASDESAQLVLTRERGGSRDIFRAYNIVLDGKQVAKIKRGKRVELPIAAGQHEIFLKIDWCRGRLQAAGTHAVHGRQPASWQVLGRVAGSEVPLMPRLEGLDVAWAVSLSEQILIRVNRRQ